MSWQHIVDSFGKEIVRKRNIDWPSEVLFVDPRIREGWVFMTFRSSIPSSWVSGCLRFLPKMGYKIARGRDD
jgi:hypothetical protein